MKDRSEGWQKMPVCTGKTLENGDSSKGGEGVGSEGCGEDQKQQE